MSPSDILRTIGAHQVEDVPPQDQTGRRRWSHLRQPQDHPSTRRSNSSCRSTQG